MGAPDERAFLVYPRGYVRDNVILAHFRNELRTLLNPTTGATFTEDEIQRATAPGTRFYIEADSIDLVGQATQSRALFFATQIDPRKANTAFLEQFHGALWLGENSRLGATGASGPVQATGTNGTIVPGSFTVPDPAAAVATDPNGKRYQNLTTKTIANGVATLTLIGIDTGFVTRLPADTELRWSAGINPGTDPVVTVLEPFDGGFDAETDEEYSARIVERIRYRPASGNATHFQAWAEESSSAVEQAFVYPCALSAGSTVVAVTEKRAVVANAAVPEGPNARIPSTGTLNTTSQYLTPPASPVVPERVLVLVTGVTAQQSNLVLRVAMAYGRNGGWADVQPWPAFSATYPQLALKTVNGTGLTLTLDTDQPLPAGVATLTGTDAPKLMIYNREISRWVQLDVLSVTDPAPGTTTVRTFTIVLSSEPTLYDDDGNARTTPKLHVGDCLSPFTERDTIVAKSLEAYFDVLGPGEMLESTDVRFARAARQPSPSVSFTYRAGQSALRYVLAALGGTASDAELTSVSRNIPDVPINVADGPNMLTLGNVNIYPL